MLFRFPIREVEVNTTRAKKTVEKPGFTNNYVRLNQHEFALDLEEVGWFYARFGDYIEVMPYPNANQSTLELYLNGSVYGAILHQRKTLPLHGSCFGYRGLGIMICGESGVGKSSLTTSFCLNGANFLTDDITPVVFRKGKPYIWAVSDRIKLWSDSLLQLNQNEAGLERIVPDQEKFYFPMASGKGAAFTLDQIFILHIHDKGDIRVQAIAGVEKFTALRNEIYRREYLQGMAESEIAYLEQLITISETVPVMQVYRPADIPIEQFRGELEKLILSVQPN